MPHTPLRRCRVCRRQLPKADLARWTVVDGGLQPDPSQTAAGRGYYSCSTECAAILPQTLKRKK